MEKNKLVLKGVLELLSIIFLIFLLTGGLILHPSLWWILLILAFLIILLNWFVRKKKHIEE
ncbi:MAG: hypothetical protein ACTSUV_00320 [Candidatus Ranarchaeia archaeon]